MVSDSTSLTMMVEPAPPMRQRGAVDHHFGDAGAHVDPEADEVGEARRSPKVIPARAPQLPWLPATFGFRSAGSNAWRTSTPGVASGGFRHMTARTIHLDEVVRAPEDARCCDRLHR